MRNKDCTLCPLCSTATTVCLQGRSVSKECKLMVIGEAPSDKDDENDDVFSSDRDRLVMDVFETAMGVSTDDIYFTYLTKCYAGRNEKPTKNDASACYEYLLEEIAEVKPKAILCLGELCLNFLLGDKGIARKHGEIYELTFTELGMREPVKVIPTFLAGYITYNEHKLKDFAKDIERAYNVANGIDVSEGRCVKVIDCLTVEAVKKLADYVREVGLAVFDFETANTSGDKKQSALDWFREETRPTCISICFQPSVSYTVPLYHPEAPWTDEERSEVIDIIWGLFSDQDVRKAGHNIKFDMHVAKKERDVTFRGRIDDTMLMHHLLNEIEKHGLKELTEKYFSNYAGYEEDVKKYKWEEVPWKVLSPYCGTDTAMTYILLVHFENMLLKDERLYTIYRNLTMPVCKVLFEMEHRGALIDRKTLLSTLAEVDVRIAAREDKLRNYPEVKRFEAKRREEAVEAMVQKLREKAETAKSARYRQQYMDKIERVRTGELKVYEGLNFNSTQQVEKLLFSRDGFGFPQLNKGTGKDVLVDLKDTTGFVDDLLGYRTFLKLRGTYMQGILDRLDSNDRLHTTYKIHGTATGRISSADPNLQNIPNVAKLKDETIIEMVGMIKRLFIAEEGCTFFNWDLSQAELRMIAAFAQDEDMMGAYNSGQDLHKKTGAHLAGVSLEEFEEKPKDWQKEKRTRAKAANFGMIYGISPEGYMDYAKKTYSVEMTLDEAKRDIAAFFSMYKRLPEYHALYKAKARKFGYVRTLYGRRRLTPNILSPSGALRSADERVAVNSPIQGSVGEWVLFVMVLASFRLPPDVYFVNTVHDSIMGSVPDYETKEVCKLMIETAENPPNMQYFGKDIKGIRMKMDAEASKTNWKEMKDFEL